jgi:hypothetical protein
MFCIARTDGEPQPMPARGTTMTETGKSLIASESCPSPGSGSAAELDSELKLVASQSSQLEASQLKFVELMFIHPTFLYKAAAANSAKHKM